MKYDITVNGEEADFEPIEATNIHVACHIVRQILARKSVWAHGVDPFTADVVIRSADGDATVKMPVECATE